MQLSASCRRHVPWTRAWHTPTRRRGSIMHAWARQISLAIRCHPYGQRWRQTAL